MVRWKHASNLNKCCDTKSDIPLALLQFKTLPLGPGLPNPSTLLLNCPSRGIIPIINRVPISIDNDDEHHKALGKRQTKMRRNMILPKIILSFP